MFNRFQYLFQINMSKESQMRAAINQKLIEMGERERWVSIIMIHELGLKTCNVKGPCLCNGFGRRISGMYEIDWFERCFSHF